MSSDTEDSAPEEDVTVVKISRRRKKSTRRGPVLEIDLTQESDGNEEDDIQVEVINRSSSSNQSGPGSQGGIRLCRFATAPNGHLPPNVQNGGSPVVASGNENVSRMAYVERMPPNEQQNTSAQANPYVR